MRTGLVIGCCVLSAFSASARSADADGVEGVNALLDRIEKAHASRDAKTLIEQCTDDGLVSIVVVGPKDNRTVRILTKPQMSPEMFGNMWRQMQLQSRRKTDRDIMLGQPDIAFFRATTVDRLADGGTVIHRDFYIARRSGGSWRICFSMPLIFHHAIYVAYVLPDSPAQRAGLKVGDEVTVCAGIKTDTFAAVHEIDVLLKSQPKDVILTVRRGGRPLRITVPGSHGLGGTGLAPTLMPLAPAVLMGPGKPHPVKEHLKREVEMLRTGRTEDFDATYHPEGYFSYFAQGGKPTRLVGLKEIKDIARQTLERARQTLDTAKTSLGTISVITDGNVAMVTGEVTFTARQTGKRKTMPSRAQVYVRRGETWLLAANLAQRIRFGPSEATRPGGEKAGAAADTADQQAARRVALDFVASMDGTKPDSTERLTKLLAEEFVQIGSNGKVYKGRKANLELYARARREIAKTVKTMTLRYDIESVRVFGGSAAVFGRIEIAGRTNDGQDFRKCIWETLVLRRAAGTWQIVHEHSSIAPEDQR